ncbi:MFS transporter [Haloimpatiens lingqiaonensis]|uniref:MFS transporter n=1 Tax=Haloimpatiens lingqiaonensis TaxID=1380675 RepID=UPI0010FE1F3C|nr:MFS transporter [Haloimpatiens lingqiaonensis]
MNIKNKLKYYFPALTHKNFRYFWIGSIVSLIGTWMQNTGQSWLVLTLTNSPFKLSLVNALQFTPVLLFSLFAGAIIDKLPKRKILIFTQSAMMILALILSLLVFTKKVEYWHILILATLLGCANTLDMPTRQSFMIELVGKDNLLNAIALNSSVFNAARLIGPAISGLMIHMLGFTWCFFLNAISFIPLIFGIYRMNVKNSTIKRRSNKNLFKEVKEGLVYISKNPKIYRTIILIGIVGTFIMNYNILIPLQAKMVLNESSKGYGYLMAYMGAGSLISAIFVAASNKSGSKKARLYFSAFSVSLALILIGFSKNFTLTGFFLFLAGVFNIIFSTTANSRIQLNSNDEYRGRVMSIYSLVFAGSTPIGSLITGYISNNFGVSITFMVNGIITLLLTLILLLTSYNFRSIKTLK